MNILKFLIKNMATIFIGSLICTFAMAAPAVETNHFNYEESIQENGLVIFKAMNELAVSKVQKEILDHNCDESFFFSERSIQVIIQCVMTEEDVLAAEKLCSNANQVSFVRYCTYPENIRYGGRRIIFRRDYVVHPKDLLNILIRNKIRFKPRGSVLEYYEQLRQWGLRLKTD